MRRQLGTRFPVADYVASKPEILKILISGYENQDVALNCGMILRESVRHEILAKIILDSDSFWDFFGYVELSTFDVASDAFATFKDCLTKHKTLVATFMEQRYDEVLRLIVFHKVCSPIEFYKLCDKTTKFEVAE